MAGNKPTAIHYILIFFVVTNILAIVAAYVIYQEVEAANATAAKEKDASTKATAAATKAQQGLEQLRKVIGYEFPEVYDEQDFQNQNTVVGRAYTDIKTYAPNMTAENLVTALMKQKQTIDQLTAQLSQTRKDIDEEKSLRSSEVANASAKADTYEQDALAAKTAREKLDTDKEEAIREKNATIAEQNRLYQQLQAEYDDYQNVMAETVKDLEDKITRYIDINKRLEEKLFEVQKVSFDKPDGYVQFVDHNSNKLWITLGKADNLPERLTFSVYKKNNDGVGQSATKGDIKGQIEVLSITGPHLAECRIKGPDNLEFPIAPGDPIFTPLWTPGRTYRFSVGGVIDMDGDGTVDRERFIDFVRSAGAKIDNMLDETGERTGDGIDIDTKFLIKANIPDPQEFAPGSEERKTAQKIAAEWGKMREEARFNAVRQISLNDFLDFMGYVPTQRVYRPGDELPYSNQNSGATNTSTGQTSDLYNGNTLQRP